MNETLSLILKAQDETKGVIAKLDKDVQGLTKSSESGGKSLSALGNVLRGIGVGVGVAIFQDLQNALGKIADLIPSLIDKGLTFASTVEQIMRATGASAETSSRFAGEMEFLGHSSEGLSLRLGVLTKGIQAHAAELDKVGIATKAADGHWLDQITTINNVRSGLNRMEDGVAKTTLATQLFGRAGADMLDWLNMSDAQVRLLDQEMDKLGITMTDQGVAKARDVSREFNLFGLSVQGVANTLLSDVAPALMGTVDQLASWVAANGRNIANFAAEVANFVLGMISALTGATFQTVTFTDKFDALGNAASGSAGALQDAEQKTTKGTGATKAATQAITDEITALDKQISKLKALETAEDAKFAKDMAHLSAKLGAELSAMSAAEKAHAIDEQQASLASQAAAAQDDLTKAMAGSATAAGDYAVQMTKAQADLAKAQKPDTLGNVNTDAVDAAQQRITDLQAGQVNAAQAQADAIKAAQDKIAAVSQQTADFQTQVTNDARRAQIAAVQAFVDAEMKSEQDAKNKKLYVEREKKEETVLQSKIAAAQQRGDLTAVSDLTVELHAVQTAVARAEQAKRNTDRETDLTKQKAQLDELKKKMAETFSGGAGSLPDVVNKGTGAAGAMIGAFRAGADRDMGLVALAAAGAKPTSMAGAFESARVAGMKFGDDMKKVLGDVAGMVGTLVTGVLGVGKAVAGLHIDGGQITMIGLGVVALGVSTANPGLVGIGMSIIAMGSAVGPGDQSLPGIKALTPNPGKGTNDLRDAKGNYTGPSMMPPPVGAPGFADGGVVPGPIGRPMLAVVHGGETVTPPGMGASVSFGAGSIIVNGASDPQATAQAVMLAIKRELTRQGMSFSSGF